MALYAKGRDQDSFAGNGQEVLAQIGACRFDVAVLYLDLPQLDGFQAVRSLGEKRLPVAAIFLTLHKDEDAFNEARLRQSRRWLVALRFGGLMCVLSCVLLVGGASAQYRFDHWTTDDGLPHNSVLAITTETARPT